MSGPTLQELQAEQARLEAALQGLSQWGRAMERGEEEEAEAERQADALSARLTSVRREIAQRITDSQS